MSSSIFFTRGKTRRIRDGGILYYGASDVGKKTCNFCDICVSSVLRDQVVLGIDNPQTQAELLKIRQLDLQRCLDICKLSENATVQSRILRHWERVNKVDFKPKRTTPAQTERERGQSGVHGATWTE